MTYHRLTFHSRDTSKKPAKKLGSDVFDIKNLAAIAPPKIKIFFDPKAKVTCLSRSCSDPAQDTQWRDDKRMWLIDNTPDAQAPCPRIDRWFERNILPASSRCTYIYRASENSLRVKAAQLHLFESSEDFWFFGVFALLLIINRLLLDINITSPHGFYRDRLSKAFLFKLLGKNYMILWLNL